MLQAVHTVSNQKGMRIKNLYKDKKISVIISICILATYLPENFGMQIKYK